MPPGFGALTGSDTAMATRGVLFESSYAPHRAPAGHSLVKAIVGGATRPEVAGWDDDPLVETVGGEVSRIIGRDISASFVEVVRHHRGIPQYVIGHSAWLQEVERLTNSMPGLHLTGWGYRGIGVAHLAADAAAVAQRIMIPAT